MSCSTNASRSAGARVSSTTSSASADRVGQPQLVLGIAASVAATGSGMRGTSSGSSRRALRERSMSRHTRATTVVSQPPRFSTSLASVRLEPQPGLLHGVVGLAGEPSMR